LYWCFSDWPEADKALWQTAFNLPTDVFDDGGPGAHLSTRTLFQLQYTWGKFLFFLAGKYPELLKRDPEQRIDAKTAKAFVDSQPSTCGELTRSIYVYHLWLVLYYLCPRENWSWLLTISERMKAQAKVKPEQHHLVTSETLYKLGFRLMDRALCMNEQSTSWRAQKTFRDGLTIALLALVPLRRRTLTALRSASI
jgi:hypothetical protein